MRSGDTLRFRLNFKPRAPRLYQARVVLHVSQPCRDLDTTILVTGLGQANPFGMSLTFDNARILRDTFPGTQCDTVRIPVYASRDIPAELIDIHCGLEYDTNQIECIGIESSYLKKDCDDNYPPSTSIKSYTRGTLIKVKNFCKVDSIAPIFTALFISKTQKRASLPIIIDSLYFDTEKVILYRIYAEPDTGQVVIKQSSLKALNTINYDSVRILDCVDTNLTLLNDGDIPIKLSSIMRLPIGMQFISSNPPLDSLFYPNDTIQCMIRFCPRSSNTMTSTIDAISSFPCLVKDTSTISGTGYAPDIEVPFSLGALIGVTDSVTGILGDKVSLPILIGEDFATVYRQIKYYLQSVSFTLQLRYNPHALKFESITVSDSSKIIVQPIPGAIVIKALKLDSVLKGEIAKVHFTIAVPDSANSDLYLEPIIVTTDSLPFVDIIPLLESAKCVISPKCDIHTLKYDANMPSLLAHAPNPANTIANIRFTLPIDAFYTLSLYSSEGRFLKVISSTNTPISKGEHIISLDVSTLENGVYFYVLESGEYSSTRKLHVIK